MQHWNRTWRKALAEIDLDNDPAFAALPAATRALGFDHWWLVILAAGPAEEPLLVHSNLPDALIQQYLKERSHISDPLRQHILASHIPLPWSAGLFAEMPALWQALNTVGLVHGFTQACHYKGLVAFLGLCRSQGELSAEEITTKADETLALANRLLVASVDCIARVEGKGAKLPELLSRREIEVLRRTASGHTAAEIGTGLALSERTVQYHISGAIRKLGVSNKTAAVAQAILLGLIRGF